MEGKDNRFCVPCNNLDVRVTFGTEAEMQSHLYKHKAQMGEMLVGRRLSMELCFRPTSPPPPPNPTLIDEQTETANNGSGTGNDEVTNMTPESDTGSGGEGEKVQEPLEEAEQPRLPERFTRLVHRLVEEDVEIRCALCFDFVQPTSGTISDHIYSHGHSSLQLFQCIVQGCDWTGSDIGAHTRAHLDHPCPLPHFRDHRGQFDDVVSTLFGMCFSKKRAAPKANMEEEEEEEPMETGTADKGDDVTRKLGESAMASDSVQKQKQETKKQQPQMKILSPWYPVSTGAKNPKQARKGVSDEPKKQTEIAKQMAEAGLQEAVNGLAQTKGPLVCRWEGCGRQLSPKATFDILHYHVLRHADVSPFVCGYCRRSYARTVSLKKHSQSYHKGKQLHVVSSLEQHRAELADVFRRCFPEAQGRGDEGRGDIVQLN